VGLEGTVASIPQQQHRANTPQHLFTYIITMNDILTPRNSAKAMGVALFLHGVIHAVGYSEAHPLSKYRHMCCCSGSHRSFPSVFWTVLSLHDGPQVWRTKQRRRYLQSMGPWYWCRATLHECHRMLSHLSRRRGSFHSLRGGHPCL